jgi:hypothetical protein
VKKQSGKMHRTCRGSGAWRSRSFPDVVPEPFQIREWVQKSSAQEYSITSSCDKQLHSKLNGNTTSPTNTMSNTPRTAWKLTHPFCLPPKRTPGDPGARATNGGGERGRTVKPPIRHPSNTYGHSPSTAARYFCCPPSPERWAHSQCHKDQLIHVSTGT